MVVEQRARARGRDNLKVCRAFLEQGQSSCDLALSNMPRGISGGRERK